MLLTLTTTRPPATDLGWLLHKHPAKVQEFELAFGRARVFYPEATESPDPRIRRPHGALPQPRRGART